MDAAGDSGKCELRFATVYFFIGNMHLSDRDL